MIPADAQSAEVPLTRLHRALGPLGTRHDSVSPSSDSVRLSSGSVGKWFKPPGLNHGLNRLKLHTFMPLQHGRFGRASLLELQKNNFDICY